MTNNKLADKLEAERIKDIAEGAPIVQGEAQIMASELLVLRDVLQWHSVDDVMPPNETTVIVRNASGTPWIADVDHDEFYPDEFPVDRMSRGEITHWMRFPE